MIPVNEQTSVQARIQELAEEVKRLRMELKPYIMAQAFRRWDANQETRDRAGQLMQDYSDQYEADIKIDLPELFQ
jgi:hypothetical protein